MQHKYIAILTAALISLTGCASLPSDAPSYSSAPIAPDGYATVYIYRVGAKPNQRKPSVLIGSQKVFEPPELAYTWVYARAVEQPFRIEWAWDTGWPPLAFTMALTTGQSYYLKISGSFENKGTVWRLGSNARWVPRGEAERELTECCKFVRAEFPRVQ